VAEEADGIIKEIITIARNFHSYCISVCYVKSMTEHIWSRCTRNRSRGLSSNPATTQAVYQVGKTACEVAEVIRDCTRIVLCVELSVDALFISCADTVKTENGMMGEASSNAIV
jgi:hypothetical protein